MAIKDLDILLKSMNPELDNKSYVFLSVSEKEFRNLKINPLLIYREKEGLTIIIDKKSADKNRLPYSEIWSLITLNVNSDLTAIGFLVAIYKKLAEAGISINAVSAYYHDISLFLIKNLRNH
ncbi:ACT domain-containing protein [Candidatus Pacearchaeota archaeon]|nr:ACT domain-containing protein [Candidatus Pacearchaeota archaeon]